MSEIRSKGHRLSEVDLEARTATCKVCGPTEIYVKIYENPHRVIRRCLGAQVSYYVPAPYKAGSHRLSERDQDAGTAVCYTCGPVVCIVRRGGLRCPNGAYRYSGESAPVAGAHRNAIAAGEASCAVCGTRENLCIDHEHGLRVGRRKVVRGILCFKHNTGIGMFDDSPELLEAAAAYLRKSQNDR